MRERRARAGALASGGGSQQRDRRHQQQQRDRRAPAAAAGPAAPAAAARVGAPAGPADRWELALPEGAVGRDRRQPARLRQARRRRGGPRGHAPRRRLAHPAGGRPPALGARDRPEPPGRGDAAARQQRLHPDQVHGQPLPRRHDLHAPPPSTYCAPASRSSGPCSPPWAPRLCGGRGEAPPREPGLTRQSPPNPPLSPPPGPAALRWRIVPSLRGRSTFPRKELALNLRLLTRGPPRGRPPRDRRRRVVLERRARLRRVRFVPRRRRSRRARWSRATAWPSPSLPRRPCSGTRSSTRDRPPTSRAVLPVRGRRARALHRRLVRDPRRRHVGADPQPAVHLQSPAELLRQLRRLRRPRLHRPVGTEFGLRHGLRRLPPTPPAATWWAPLAAPTTPRRRSGLRWKRHLGFEEVSGSSCTSNAGCTGIGESCDTSLSVCIDGGETCASDSDCSGSGGDSCVDGECIAGDTAAGPRPPPPPVTVTHQGTVGPYQTVTLHANGKARRAPELGSRRTATSSTPAVALIIDAYTSEGFDFIALVARPGQGRAGDAAGAGGHAGGEPDAAVAHGRRGHRTQRGHHPLRHRRGRLAGAELPNGNDPRGQPDVGLLHDELELREGLPGRSWRRTAAGRGTPPTARRAFCSRRTACAARSASRARRTPPSPTPTSRRAWPTRRDDGHELPELAGLDRQQHGAGVGRLSAARHRDRRGGGGTGGSTSADRHHQHQRDRRKPAGTSGIGGTGTGTTSDDQLQRHRWRHHRGQHRRDRRRLQRWDRRRRDRRELALR